MTVRHIVVIGGGPAGVFAAIEAKRRDASAEVTLVSDEPSEPYERPPLSKAVLLGKARAADAPIAGPKGMAGHGVTLVLHTRCAAIDRAAREVVPPRRAGACPMTRSSSPPARWCARSRRCRSATPRVHYLRTEAHADALAAELKAAQAPRGGRRRPDRPRSRGLRLRAGHRASPSSRSRRASWRGYATRRHRR